VPLRGLSGPGYRGHVFWDSDVFVLAFLAATHPAAARAMLEYRIRRLGAAKEAAKPCRPALDLGEHGQPGRRPEHGYSEQPYPDERHGHHENAMLPHRSAPFCLLLSLRRPLTLAPGARKFLADISNGARTPPLGVPLTGA
jgi:hypothetical protein